MKHAFAWLRWTIWPRLSYLCLDGCEHCGRFWGTGWESSRTAYPYDGLEGLDQDPNRPLRYCRPCAAEHHEYWDGMWAEYRNSQGY